MPAQKKYKTAAALRRAVERYFASISRFEQLTEQVPVEFDEQGVASRFETRPVENADGEYMSVRRYLIPPTVAGMCLYLGVTRQTLDNYAKDPAYREVLEEARMLREMNLNERLLTEPHVRGIEFDLKNNYGWTDKQQIDARTEVVMDGELDVYTG